MCMVNADVVSTKFQLRIKKIKRAAHKGITGKCKGDGNISEHTQKRRSQEHSRVSVSAH